MFLIRLIIVPIHLHHHFASYPYHVTPCNKYNNILNASAYRPSLTLICNGYNGNKRIPEEKKYPRKRNYKNGLTNVRNALVHKNKLQENKAFQHGKMERRLAVKEKKKQRITFVESLLNCSLISLL